MEQLNTFVLDNERYEIDSLPPKAKYLLQRITEYRKVTELHLEMGELSINTLTTELKTMVGEFTKVEEPVEEVKAD